MSNSLQVTKFEETGCGQLFYSVQYCDGDSEEIEEGELLVLLQDYHEKMGERLVLASVVRATFICFHERFEWMIGAGEVNLFCHRVPLFKVQHNDQFPAVFASPCLSNYSNARRFVEHM